MGMMFDTSNSRLQICASRHSIKALQSNPHPAINQSYFTQLAYLQSQRSDKLVIVMIRSVTGAERYLVFADHGKYLDCCNRLSKLSGTEINQICEHLFEYTQAHFIKFEDVDFLADEKCHFPAKLVSFQENWHCQITNNSAPLSNRQASNLRRKFRKLKEFESGQTVNYEFRRCTPKDIDAVISMNKETLSHHGRTHHFSEEKQKLFKAVCADFGYIAGLFIGRKLIAGSIINIVGIRAYFNVVGYDLEYAKFSPGLQVHTRALTDCKEIGCTQANLLWGNSRWKSDIGGTRMPLTTLIVNRSKRTYLKWQFWSIYLPLFSIQIRRSVKNCLNKIRQIDFDH